MIAMALELQLDKLNLLQQVFPENKQYVQDLKVIQIEVTSEEAEVERQSREEAEQRVMLVVLEHGEMIGHGDLMTFQKINEAIMRRAGEVRAIDRLDYLGVFRLQLFHMVMAKTSADILAGMPRVSMVEDRGSLSNAAAQLGILGWFTNNKKAIVRAGNYERHAQHWKAYAVCLLLNMFGHFSRVSGVNPGSLRTKKEVVDFLSGMLRHFGALWYWDKDAVDPQEQWDCDLFKASRDQVVRLVLDLAFRKAQHQNDALALRALRRTMLVIFAASSVKSRSGNSKYALYTLIDLVG